MSWMYNGGRTSSMPAGQRSSAGSSSTRPSALSRNVTAYDRDNTTSGYTRSYAPASPSYPTTSSSSALRSSANYNDNNRYSMEPSYSSGPQFDSHGHSLSRGTGGGGGGGGVSSSSSTSYLRNTNSSSVGDPYNKFMSAVTESSHNASRVNPSSYTSNLVSSIAPPTKSSASSSSQQQHHHQNPSHAVDRNPLQFSSDVYGRRSSGTYNNNEDSPATTSTSSSTPYYRELTGAHNYTGVGSRGTPSSQNRHSSAAVSSGVRRTGGGGLDYNDRYATASMAHGASVSNSPSKNTTTSSSTRPNFKTYGDAEDDSDDEDGIHISAAAKGGAALRGNFSNSSSSYQPPSPSISKSNRSSTSTTPVGLRNIGNTCYMNASLQCILQASGFFLTSLPGGVSESASGKSKLTKALLNLAKASNIQDLMAVKAGAATLNHEFHGGRQNDAHEFIREFLHALHIELNRVGKAPYKEMKDIDGESDADASKRWFSYFRSHDDSIVTDYFGGFMRATTVCGSCNHRSLSFSPVWDLSLSMSSTGSSGSNIPAMIKDFMKVDVLGSDGAFICAKCKKKRNGKRQSMLVNWPKVLVLHLCRFTYSGARNSQSVDFPARLDQSMIPMPASGSSTSNGDPINGYSLSGVVLHRGTSNFGHYTALVKPYGSRQWFNCDDSMVNPISENEVLRHRTEAYVLFYTMDEI